jgi:hypothetical protein
MKERIIAVVLLPFVIVGMMIISIFDRDREL